MRWVDRRCKCNASVAAYRSRRRLCQCSLMGWTLIWIWQNCMDSDSIAAVRCIGIPFHQALSIRRSGDIESIRSRRNRPIYSSVSSHKQLKSDLPHKSICQDQTFHSRNRKSLFLHLFQSHRHRPKHITHNNCGPPLSRRRLFPNITQVPLNILLRDDTTSMTELVCLCDIFTIDLGRESNIADDTETSNGFSSESISSYRIDVLKRTDFGRRMSLTEKSPVVGENALAIISALRYICRRGGYANVGESVVFDGEGYVCCVCVNRVFDEFFEW